MMKIQMHWKEIDQIRKGEAGYLFLEPTSQIVNQLNLYIKNDGTIEWKSPMNVFAKCIEDEHESEEFVVKDIYFGRNKEDKKNHYKCYLIIKFEIC